MNIPQIDDLKNPNQFGKLYIKKHYPEFYEWILSKYKNYLQSKFPAYLYMYFNNMDSPHVCPVCGKETVFLDYKRGFQKYCSLKCSNSDPQVKQKKEETNLKNWGTKTPAESKIIKDKVISTYIKNNGGMGNASESVKEKQNQTMLNKYGVIVGFNIDGKRDDIKEGWLKKYGVNHPSKCPEIKEKIKNTYIKNNGGLFCQSESVKEKSKQTCLEKYGSEYVMQVDDIKTKANKTKQLNYKYRILNNNLSVLDVFEKKYNDKLVTWFKIKCNDENCQLCKNKYFELPSTVYYDRTRDYTEMCSIKMPIKSGHNSGTSQEIHVRELLDRYNIEYVVNTKSILNGLELDVYIPSHHIAIECNGVYWHSTRHKIKDYHYNKMLMCREKGIQLLTIWQDWDVNKRDIVDSIILSKLGIYSKRIGARSCKIKEINSSICSEFLNKNHIQGKVKSNVRIGLYYKNELVAVMTFTKNNSRFMGSKEQWTLSRFCSSLHTQVVGGAMRLLKYFINHYSPESINSFASNDISNGALYKNLGFEEGSHNDSYWYINPHTYQRYHRYSFNKRDLVRSGEDPNLTEEIIMLNKGYCKIYDCGTTKYTLNLC